MERNVPDIESISRREFLKQSSAVGLSLGLPPFLISCSGTSTNEVPLVEVRTLFFNFSLENAPGKIYFLVSDGHTYPLQSVSQAPEVLQTARATNSFLSAIPDQQITHYIENINFANNSVTLCYIASPIDGQPGAWSMPMIYLHIPNSGADFAFNAANHVVPISNKRAFYNQSAAQSPADLRNENALVDSHNHAASLIMLHPSLLSGEPNSAYYIYSKHVGTGILTKKLAETLQTLGPAQPGKENVSNPTGWATLQPILDNQNNPIVNPYNNLNQYFPDWHPNVDLAAAPAMVQHINNTRNDPILGATIKRGSTIQPDDVNGKIWFQRDGFTTVNPESGAVAAVQGDNVSYTLLDQSPEPGLDVTVTFSQSGSTTVAEITVSNSFLRYLGVFIQFLDDKKQVIPLSKVSGYPNNIQDNHNTFIDTATEMFLGMVAPELTILGIPVKDGTETFTINLPPQTTQLRILSSGLSLGGVAANTHPGTIAPGITMTAIINYGFTLLFMAAGAAGATSLLQSFLRTLDIVIVEDLITLLGTDIANGNAPGNASTWKKIAIILGKLLAKPSAVTASKLVLALVQFAIEEISAATAASAIPIIGEIQRAIACVIGVIDITHTTIDLAESPWTYFSDLTLTHDLSITLLKDPKSPGFPNAATQYKVTALFEDGTPYVQMLPLTSAGPATLPPVIFKNVPLGGQVNVSVAFLQQGAEDVLLGKGTTGLVDNSVDAQPSITIEQLQFPIGATTFYQHQQKITLAANSNGGVPVHVWTVTKIAPTATINNTSSGNQQGDLSNLNSITVRQATSVPPVNGYIGYSWRAYSSGIPNCTGGGVVQSDQIANLNSPPAMAQNGYIVNSCGLPSGVKMTYSLLSHATTNFYLDTSIDPASNLPRNLLRQVQLDPTPSFDSSTSNRAWGKLNFSSTALLLHPAGKIVSVSLIDNQMETLTLPSAPLPDDQAAVQLRAIRHGGEGNLPGLFSDPVAATISPDGVVIILEQGNNRLHALDVNGNPVPYFIKQSQTYFLNLTATASGDVQYLDIAVEFTGFLYILSYNQGQQLYRLDIYHPKQIGTAPISTTLNVNAGRLAVDFWRNMYTLNYEVLQFDNLTVTEPSISLWTPCIVGNAC